MEGKVGSALSSIHEFIDHMDPNVRWGLISMMWLSFTVAAAVGKQKIFFGTTGLASLITGLSYYNDGLWWPGTGWTADFLVSYGIVFFGWGQGKKRGK